MVTPLVVVQIVLAVGEVKKMAWTPTQSTAAAVRVCVNFMSAMVQIKRDVKRM